MPIKMRTLAEDATGAWKVAFDLDELHLYIAFAPPGCVPDPVDGMTIEDFLITIPTNALQQSAHGAFLQLLSNGIGEEN
ncbi:hypothetical protein [Nitratireductor luteus]|uniref:hypothetical protein n=1 Tax=Nitratireductor luteus TaxID=2976980 RepID=UPI00223ED2F3|nr:hypothetical protein [Nitratireductor luteus]